MYIVKKYKPDNRRSPWALYGPDGLIALFVYQKGAHAVMRHLIERDRLLKANVGLLLIILELPNPEPRHLDRVADR